MALLPGTKDGLTIPTALSVESKKATEKAGELAVSTALSVIRETGIVKGYAIADDVSWQYFSSSMSKVCLTIKQFLAHYKKENPAAAIYLIDPYMVCASSFYSMVAGTEEDPAHDCVGGLLFMAFAKWIAVQNIAEIRELLDDEGKDLLGDGSSPT